MMNAYGLILNEQFQIIVDEHQKVYTVTAESEDSGDTVKAVDEDGNTVEVSPYAYVTLVE